MNLADPYIANMLCELGKKQIRGHTDEYLKDRLGKVRLAEGKARIEIAAMVDRGIVGLAEAMDHHKAVDRLGAIVLARKKIEHELEIRAQGNERTMAVRKAPKKSKPNPPKIPTISYAGWVLK